MVARSIASAKKLAVTLGLGVAKSLTATPSQQQKAIVELVVMIEAAISMETVALVPKILAAQSKATLTPSHTGVVE